MVLNALVETLVEEAINTTRTKRKREEEEDGMDSNNEDSRRRRSRVGDVTMHGTFSMSIREISGSEFPTHKIDSDKLKRVLGLPNDIKDMDKMPVDKRQEWSNKLQQNFPNLPKPTQLQANETAVTGKTHFFGVNCNLDAWIKFAGASAEDEVVEFLAILVPVPEANWSSFPENLTVFSKTPRIIILKNPNEDL